MTLDRKATQTRLGVTPDGIFGRGTYSALLRLVASPKAKPEVIASLANAAVIHFPEYGIDASSTRLIDWLAQTGNETGGYTAFEENLNYRASVLVAQWPRHFTAATAAAAVGKPYEIAEIAYGVASRSGKGRMGNDKPGDGFRYRGQGMLQLTGKANFYAADRRLGLGLDTNPELAAVPAVSLLIACDFYRENKVLEALDDGDTEGARRITNVGNRFARNKDGSLVKPIGLDHVNTLRAKLSKVIV